MNAHNTQDNNNYGDEHECLGYSIPELSEPNKPTLLTQQEVYEFKKLLEGWQQLCQTHKEQIDLLIKRNRHLAASLKRIADLDYQEDSDECNEWAEADCFRQAQRIAHDALQPIASIDRSKESAKLQA